jgi:sulfofructose kinase
MQPTMKENTRFDVLGFGAVAVDDLLYVDEYPPAEGKVRVRHRVRQCGGLTGTALVAAARLGARAAYVGRIGDDVLSQEVVEQLRREGVDVEHSVRRQDARPAHSTIIVDQTRQTRTVFSSLEGELGADPELPEAELIRSARVLLVDHHGLQGTLRAMRVASRSGVQVVADFERSAGPGFEELLAAVDHLVVSERFARELTGRSNAADAVAALESPARKAAVVTCGGAGCWYLSGAGSDLPGFFPAYSVQVLDTTGCGDVFHGAYAVALAEGRDLVDRLAFASATAALKATQRGGQAGIPRREAVEAFLDAAGDGRSDVEKECNP